MSDDAPHPTSASDDDAITVYGRIFQAVRASATDEVG
jgi:hypothetical protein